MEILIKAAQLILSLSILIILHEAGHFIPARLFKIRVEKFYLFFDPWFSLFKFKKGDTEYGIGWLPLGGYVKIAGMVDESMDKEQMKEPAKDWEFRSKPAWQRLIVMLGGVTVNIILGFLIYCMIAFVWGVTVLPIQNAKFGAVFVPEMVNLGFQTGDKVISIDGKKVVNFDEIGPKIVNDKAKVFIVDRNGETKTILIPDTFVQKTLLTKKKKGLIAPAYPFIVNSLREGDPAIKAGIRKGDQIVAVNKDSIRYFEEFFPKIEPLSGKTASLGIIRDGKKMSIQVNVTDDGHIGVYQRSYDKFLPSKTEHYSFFQSIPKGFELASEKLSAYVSNFKYVFTKEGVKQMGGFGTFGSLFAPVWDWASFWNLTAFISIILAFMNILPIPALDGGHVMFLLYEMITRRKPNQKVMEYAQLAGMVLLLALFVFANGNDVFRHLRN
ncbi:MAG: RIP metalloprotease RseP [Bacteroidia bacterium]